MNIIKVKITTQLDIELKEVFELTETIHHYSYQDALERGVREIFISLNQQEFLDQEILRNQNEITKLSQRQLKLHEAKEKLKDIKIELLDTKIKNNGTDLEEKRIKSLSVLLKTPWKEWTGLNKRYAVESGEFKDRDEMENWVLSQQKEMIL